MPRRNSSFLDDVIAAPWPVGVVLAVFSYVGLKFLLPVIAIQNPFLKAFAAFVPTLAPILAFLFLACAALSAFNAMRKGALFNRQTGINSIRLIGWHEFEELLGESYRQKGFAVKEPGGGGADGGVDLEIKKDGKTFFVQCKHWREDKVGVKIIRELYGVVAARGAAGGIVISSGTFTQEARDFAQGRQLELVDGNGLVRIITEVKEGKGQGHESIVESTRAERCPQCGSSLVLRTAKKGPTAGSRFWGCSSFPRCKYTKAYEG